MANEIDADPGIARHGQHGEDVRTLDNLGLDRRRVAEWREVRDAGDDVVERALRNALREGRAPTKGEILQAARDIRNERQGDKKERRAERERDLAARQSALPDKRYGVIYADPEWRFEVYSRDTGMDRAADNHYPTSSTEDICNRPVADIAADDCVLFLWATVPMLPDALRVMDAWDFQYKSHCIWAKDRIGTGYWFRNQHEILLVGTRGNVPAPAMGTQVESLVDAPVGRHSEKPEKFYQLIELYFPNLPKIELNARAARPGWDAWGYEAPAGTEAA
jgi:N6-adenosine-specific RNA methylase IME4